MAEESSESYSTQNLKRTETGYVWSNTNLENEPKAQPRRPKGREFRPTIQKKVNGRRGFLKAATAAGLSLFFAERAVSSAVGNFFGKAQAQEMLVDEQISSSTSPDKSSSSTPSSPIAPPEVSSPVAKPPEEALITNKGINAFELFALTQSPNERKAELEEKIELQAKKYRNQVGVERQLLDTLFNSPFVERQLVASGCPQGQLEERKAELLAKIFVESGGNTNAVQERPNNAHTGVEKSEIMGQGLFQINWKAAKDVMTRTKTTFKNLKDPDVNSRLAIEYTKWMEEIFVDRLIASAAYHTGQGNMFEGVKIVLNRKIGIPEKELENLQMKDVKKYLEMSYPQLGNRKITIFDIFMDPAVQEDLFTFGKKHNSSISFDYITKLLAAARLLNDKETIIWAKSKYNPLLAAN